MQTKYVTMQVTVTVNIPDEVEATDEKVLDAALGAITQSCGIDVGPLGKIVWADVFAEVHEEDCEISDFA